MNMSEDELEMIIQSRMQAAKKPKKKKKRMSSNKKALFLAFGICGVLLTFTMLMIYLEKDTSSLSILATAGVGILPIFYNIYNKAETKINLKHMEENYNPNYDEEKGIY